MCCFCHFSHAHCYRHVIRHSDYFFNNNIKTTQQNAGIDRWDEFLDIHNPVFISTLVSSFSHKLRRISQIAHSTSWLLHAPDPNGSNLHIPDVLVFWMCDCATSPTNHKLMPYRSILFSDILASPRQSSFLPAFFSSGFCFQY